jgi:hypothetical protein
MIFDADEGGDGGIAEWDAITLTVNQHDLERNGADVPGNPLDGNPEELWGVLGDEIISGQNRPPGSRFAPTDMPKEQRHGGALRLAGLAGELVVEDA